jgi:HEPN domain-containing protein
MKIESKDHLERCINSVSTQSFRDQADRDYISARLACRYELYPQFLWASQQAVEKYLKAILLYNRIPATKINHKIDEALKLTENLNFKIDLSSRSKDFLSYLSEYGEYRYLDVPYYVNGYLMIDLDLTVWELRRYCQVLNSFVSDSSIEEKELLKKALDDIEKSKSEPRYKFKLHSGLLENIIADRKHPSRPALLWQNAVFGSRYRKTIRAKNHLNAQNSILYLYPYILEELLKYIKIPNKLADAYREHLKQKI